MFLEQLILKHNAHEQCINIKEIHQGIDFYFANRAHGQKFIDFLQVRSHPPPALVLFVTPSYARCCSKLNIGHGCATSGCCLNQESRCQQEWPPEVPTFVLPNF
jgi:hypothetical protein